MTVTLVKKVEIKEIPFYDRKLLNGLNNRYDKQSKIDFILKIERLLSEYRYACYSLDTVKQVVTQERLLQELVYTIKVKAKSWANKWKNKGIGTAEFESAFYDTLWRLCDSYQWYSNYYFHETLCKALDRRALKVIRKPTKNKQGKFDNKLKSLENVTDKELLVSSIQIEDDALTKVIFDQIQKILLIFLVKITALS